MKKLKACFRLMRCTHYIKNVLVFLPLFFSGRIYDTSLLSVAILGFLAFCSLSSVVYIFNDIQDADRDRLHPKKKYRPIPSGDLSISQAVSLAILLLVMALFFMYQIEASPSALFCCGLYLGINLVYSCGGKHIPVLDVVLLGAGYPLRVHFGGDICRIAISSWLFLTVLCLSFYLGLGKRRGEYVKLKDVIEGQETTRPVLEKYTLSYLDGEMYLCLGLGLVFYSLWALEKSYELVYTVPIVLIVCMQYNLLLATSADGDPVDMLFSSKMLMLLGVVYVVVLGMLVYG